ncbi:hypothetical protein ACFL2T_00220 [Elusimicrobiota bacterium]
MTWGARILLMALLMLTPAAMAEEVEYGPHDAWFDNYEICDARYIRARGIVKIDEGVMKKVAGGSVLVPTVTPKNKAARIAKTKRAAVRLAREALLEMVELMKVSSGGAAAGVMQGDPKIKKKVVGLTQKAKVVSLRCDPLAKNAMELFSCAGVNLCWAKVQLSRTALNHALGTRAREPRTVTSIETESHDYEKGEYRKSVTDYEKQTTETVVEIQGPKTKHPPTDTSTPPRKNKNPPATGRKGATDMSVGELERYLRR